VFVECRVALIEPRAGRREPLFASQPLRELTAIYLRDALFDVAKRKQIKVSRIARGVPAGAEIENVSSAILNDALSGRQAFEAGR
jgi:recombinational DNA repair protein RecR